MNTRCDERSRESGYTLVELMMVLAIMAFVMALGIPMFNAAQGKAALESGTRVIVAALRETRGQAIALRREEAFVIDTASGAFRAGEAAAPQYLPKGLQSSLFTTTQERINETVGRVLFFADGSSTGGGVRLNQGGRQFDVLVDWLTGRVSTAGVPSARQ